MPQSCIPLYVRHNYATIMYSAIDIGNRQHWGIGNIHMSIIVLIHIQEQITQRCIITLILVYYLKRCNSSLPGEIFIAGR